MYFTHRSCLSKDKEVIINYLSKQDLSAEDIDYVICTHGDADHTSNNNLFPNAKLVLGSYIIMI
ncbi:hypothetical protein CO180_01605 [candidate division WWE3 bacterium CG_4_9_14_3_um_filter_41_6]|uniref:Metallo-beta-lactamase domain-containing protein 1 n=1 Tax=candidate division WWE3 bacterium CG_4_10_14_0_2_um_filter_41_14 TaxID=1975072 RepID=A0A2M7TEI8_UNCKA|nr:MAG: hypothetical protein COY32_07175 [candidate division WWE3 bacterium CG_4_10_14_0_2_um_filter_41_14]PJA39087.1 MAG: hypothetical protein CO180_01605 [candidate division WWE3 bacterium CG_4_9_14_3_um_filter_41_6]